jgi:transposase
MTVIIGVDPHKATHTAVAIGCDEAELGTVTVRATKQQTDRLVDWAKPFTKRTWAIESAGGLGYLLAQQLVDAGEQVLDVPATLASRVRVLGTGKSDKNDPNDARSVAIAALRSKGLRTVQAANHADVLRLLAKRNRDIGSLRTKVVCRLRARSPHWPQVELPRNSTLLTPMGCSECSSRPLQRKPSAISWPWSCWRTFVVSTPS